MGEPYVGILVNDTLYEGIPQGKTNNEAISYYRDAAMQYGVIPAYFRIQDVISADTLKVTAIIQRGHICTLELIDLPKVIHNRAIYLDHRSYQIMESWIKRGILIFNRWNRYSKLLIHQLLMKDEVIRPHLPGTYPATLHNVKQMMQAYDSLIIKPTNSSIGRGVMKLDRIRTGWKLIYPKSMKLTNKTWNTMRFRKTVPTLLRTKISRRAYIVQQRLPLATYDGRPFDLRISVQRGAGGDWQITGIVAKVASRKLFLTNVAQGGAVMTLPAILAEEYPNLDAAQVCQQIADFSLRVARHLSRELPHMADMGLDIGITKDGYPLFIECNGKDQRYSFREAGMMEEWRATYYNPIAYAKYLLDGGTPVY
ncbi:YheC/YheD family endospore coat-associated protein [Paenibacillus hexagrammi]|uniref:YheC/YheD family protein n=1 Tax=Paenibacillus hexagrammi TaxID=2908839 RepID=A0ABY3SDQ4_9BACL|nr:YheC/YheD family protein [Paenibacillus sp. YPD9-1]UJF32114.1 YheC/YheD family protein [Paenibacillus sp. YPD9-1]